ncbi:MAG TPA: nuclear transport factor 2 family protein [Castellaniella sp.]|uniref:nuclear transport factor 2 family protein n=1 Tax=Castellaniella sp. TaxID=1955812 RepID=UPI002F1B21AC
MSDTTSSFMEQLRAERDIKNTLQQYCRGVDRRDFERVREAYHADAEDHHGPYNGNIDGLIGWMVRRHEGVAQSMHFLGNCVIDWRSDRIALVETYCVTYQRLKADGASSLSDVGLTVGNSGQQTQVRCRYLDRFEKRNGQWKIAHRVVAYDSLLLEESPAQSPFAGDMQLSTRNHDDPLYALLA